MGTQHVSTAAPRVLLEKGIPKKPVDVKRRTVEGLTWTCFPQVHVATAASPRGPSVPTDRGFRKPPPPPGPPALCWKAARNPDSYIKLPQWQRQARRPEHVTRGRPQKANKP